MPIFMGLSDTGKSAVQPSTKEETGGLVQAARIERA
jgi:hypothetical protein